MTETPIPDDYVDVPPATVGPALDAERLNEWAERTNLNSAFRLSAGLANGVATLGPDGTLAASQRWTGGGVGGGGGSIDTFDFWENWANNTNGAPTTADSGQTYTLTSAGSGGVQMSVDSGVLTFPYNTGTSSAAGYADVPLGNPGIYGEGEFRFNGTGTDGTTVAAVLFETAPPGGSSGVGTERAPVHWIWTPTYSAFQVADTAGIPGAVANIDVQVYTTPSDVPQKFAYAIDRANNRVVAVYPNGKIVVLQDIAHNMFKNVAGNYPTQEILYTTPNSDKRAEWHSFRAAAVIGADNVEYASKYDQLIAIGKVIAAGGSVGLNVTYAPAPGGVDDTAIIQAAHDALPSGGGVIYLQPGVYMLSTGVTFTKKVRLIGAGMNITRIGANWTNGTAITCTVGPCSFSDFSMENINFGTQTGGAAIHLTDGTESEIRRVYIYNFYDNIVIDSGYYWSILGCHIFSPWRYGIRVQSTINNDSGDMFIVGNWFDVLSVSRNAVSALQWETGSGLRLLGNKFNGSQSAYKFATHVNVAFNAASTAVQNSADMFIQNNSIENPGTTGVNIDRAAGTYSLFEVQVQDNEFMACPTNISIGQSIEDFIVSGNVMLNDPSTNPVGIDILSGSGKGTIGPNRFNGITTPVHIHSGASPGLVVERQDIVNSIGGTLDGKVIVNDMAGSVGVPRVDLGYSRPIDWTVNATPTAIFAMLPVNQTAGVIELLITGKSATDSGFIAALKFAYAVDNAGVVTEYDMEAIQIPNAHPTITVTKTTNSIVLKFSTSDAAAVTNGIARIKVDGLMSEFRIGA